MWRSLQVKTVQFLWSWDGASNGAPFSVSFLQWRRRGSPILPVSSLLLSKRWSYGAAVQVAPQFQYNLSFIPTCVFTNRVKGKITLISLILWSWNQILIVLNWIWTSDIHLSCFSSFVQLRFVSIQNSSTHDSMMNKLASLSVFLLIRT